MCIFKALEASSAGGLLVADALLELQSVPSELCPASTTPVMRAAVFAVLLVGLTVHLRLRLAHRLQGNFLSHFVFVFAQLLQAIGVLPADFGTMPSEAGNGSWFSSLPWTV